MTSTSLEFVFAAAFALDSARMGRTQPTSAQRPGRPRKKAANRIFTQTTDGCHYSCECGPLKDFGLRTVYHRHLHMLCLPVRCRDQDCKPTPSEGVCRHIPSP